MCIVAFLLSLLICAIILVIVIRVRVIRVVVIGRRSVDVAREFDVYVNTHV